ncbi:multidrug efflux pump subunit AcrB [Sphingobium sp. B1D7B]|uniref:efflux RND transporter permease subunit n=1 Tax=unclassified Sphingobium TaxID=2611147 RepID=UPI002224C72E|nr:MULTISPECIES: efflux RND transporter permease subunit [unclassified Sphingobium]MCW2349705.1 multidrug efflux pump subunit AcrB [Sphingobium sp. B12D2B]MCW2368809.1 multidrug efflux pump subunit AcrB [Sphingobium sp. B11D3D]MCW2382480.1 multidrug efflux pump subunit AcrB [Sphingobium sp. B2D3B]MCW2391496.1 multidrug efflux pump subunit AcrB [Sphingobium sp. B11D3A]MCW2397347.1 multidrug efflux pump subunit AcrB [Sphingobium sp. B2D3C]
MSLRNISAWSIRNPVPPIVLFIGLLLAGIIAFSRMAVVDNPDIDFPAVNVTISQPGAAPTEIETQITQRVEAAVRSINGVDEIQSTASEGSSQTFVQFQIGVDSNVATQEVKNAVDQIRSDLPDGILEPFVQKVEVGGAEIAFFSVQASDMTIEQLSWFVDDTVAKRLLGIEGMARVGRGGGVDREIRVTLDPAKMQSLGVTASQVNQALRQVNVNAAGGQAEIAGSRQSVRVLGNAQDAYSLGQTQISLGNGRTILLADIASVTDGYGEQKRLAKVGGKQVVNFSIERAKGASDVSVFDETLKVLKQLETENPGIRFYQRFNSVNYTKSQYSSSMHALIEGAVLAVIVVFIFLRDWRATVISAIAIPLSAIPTFYFMDLMGFNLNSLSLLALGLVAGVLVDDAIVEIENIVRHMRMGKTAYQASIDAADEIGLAVVATTMSIVAVFFPVALMPGITGQFFKNFGFTVVIAVLISLAVARMITPLVAAYFLEHHGEEKHGEGWLMDRYMSLLGWALDDRKAKAYARGGGLGRRIRARFLDHRVWMMGFGLAAFALTVILLISMPKQFEPNADQDFSRINIEAVPGTTLRQSEAIADQVTELLNKQPEVDTAMANVGEGNARIFITLKKDRKRTSIEFERELAPRLAEIADARVSFASQQGGFGTGRDISVMLSGSDPALLEETATKVAEEMKSLPGVVAPRVNADMQRPELIIRPRLDLAAQLGVTTSALSQTIRIATLGDIDQNSAKFSLSDRQVPIRVMLPESARRDLSNIENLPVPTAGGGTVPLSRVAEISFGSGPTSIQRYAQQRRIFVGADLAQGAVKGPVMEAINKLPTMRNLPQGVSNQAVGSDRWQEELIQNFVIAVTSGVLLVFAVLVLLYKRFISPLVNMCSLALAPLGGLLLMLVMNEPLSLPVYIGLLMLLGIVGKNSILLIDFALEEMDKGVPKFEAIMEAGHKRAQPIVMTTVAMTAGMVPTALSLTGDGAWRSPMGITVIGGLILSTLLTLAIVPAAFSLADGVEKRIGPWLRRRVLTYDGKGEAAQPAE